MVRVFDSLSNFRDSNIQTSQDVTQVAAGYFHACARLSNGAVKCWGQSGSQGRLGDGTINPSSIPVAVVGLSSGVSTVATGTQTSCALMSTGSIKCWGLGYYGGLGNASTADSLTPVAAAGIANAVELVAGNGHFCARLSTGTVLCWGANSSGQVGDGTLIDKSVPTATGITTAVSLAGGTSHSCAALTNGTVQCWGVGNGGQLGNGLSANSSVPVLVSGLSTAIKVAAGVQHSCALLSGGALNCWGVRSSGQLGDGSFGAVVASPGANVPALSGLTQISAADKNTCAVTGAGGILCWGYQDFGQIGNGTSAIAAGIATPQSVTGAASGAISISNGRNSFSLAVINNQLMSWGNNTDGVFGTGISGGLSLVPVAAGPF